MMTVKKFTRVNGHIPTVEHNGAGWMASCECDCDEPTMLVSTGATEAQALASLMHVVYQKHRQVVFTRAGWKCEECGAVTGVAVHHKIHRSKVRDDRLSNLKVCCPACHAREHGT